MKNYAQIFFIMATSQLCSIFHAQKFFIDMFLLLLDIILNNTISALIHEKNDPVQFLENKTKKIYYFMKKVLRDAFPSSKSKGGFCLFS